MAAENYHLKWDSHLTYLNSSVATLYKNEKFADVVLYSSYSNSNGNSDIPTVGISAHKFILSSCSQFFATMFETAPITAPNGVLYIVLPPDLSHRAIQILVQYMYSGEATVSNDILNEVLRGGEILKIRGLCRTNSLSTSTHHGHSHHHHHHQQQPRETGTASHYGANGTRSTLPPIAQLPNDIYGGNKCTPSSSNCSSSTRYSMDHVSQQQQQQFRGLGVSVMPKDSPVIVKSPKLTHTGLLNITAGGKHHASAGGISVNKEVAIDPEDKCCYQVPSSQQEVLHVPPPQPPPPVPQQSMTLCAEVGCRSCPMSTVDTESESMRRRHRSNRTDERLERDYIERPSDDHHTLCEREEVSMVFDRRLRRESASERVRDYFVPEHFEQHGKPFVETTVTSVARLGTPSHPHNFLAIKQEPTDWSNNAPTTNDNSSDTLLQHRPPTPSLQSPKSQPLDFKMPLNNAVKLEANIGPCIMEDEDKLRNYNNSFKLLVCEVCQKTFEDTKALLRHLETHATDSLERNQTSGASSSNSGSTTALLVTNSSESLPKTYVPKKRRRISQQENNMDHVTLLCDLCTTSFETPAEWVRHMNNQHTEIELAMFNSKKDGEQKNNPSASANNNNVAAATASTGSASQSTQHQPHQSQQLPQITPHKKYSSRQSLMMHKRAGANTPHAAANGNDNATSNINTSIREASNSNAVNEQCDHLNNAPSHA